MFFLLPLLALGLGFGAYEVAKKKSPARGASPTASHPMQPFNPYVPPSHPTSSQQQSFGDSLFHDLGKGLGGLFGGGSGSGGDSGGGYSMPDPSEAMPASPADDFSGDFSGDAGGGGSDDLSGDFTSGDGGEEA